MAPYPPIENPLIARLETVGAGGQLFWAHAYYVASNIAWPRGDVPLARRDAAAVTVFGFEDLATSILHNALLACGGTEEAHG
jgi:hypothetical protein